jgi:YidC/Oxa1 family membrane protein insertase
MEQRNLIIAMVLSVAILLGFQYFFDQPRQQREAAQRTQQTAQTPGGPVPAAPTAAPPGAGPAAPVAPGATATPASVGESRAAILAASPRLKIDTPRLHGSIALVGGRIDDLTLAQYHETVDPKSPEVVMLSPAGTASPYFAEIGWAPADKTVKVPDG